MLSPPRSNFSRAVIRTGKFSEYREHDEDRGSQPGASVCCVSPLKTPSRLHGCTSSGPRRLRPRAQRSKIASGSRRRRPPFRSSRRCIFRPHAFTLFNRTPTSVPTPRSAATTHLSAPTPGPRPTAPPQSPTPRTVPNRPPVSPRRANGCRVSAPTTIRARAGQAGRPRTPGRGPRRRSRP